jgi:phospholipid/cholesterol/gamma-HCH transport system substrate-binding protein
MQKQAPTFGRLLVMVSFALSCFALLLFLWLAFGGAIPLKPKGYRFSATFVEGTQLAKEADVRISGVSVGKVKTIDVQADGRSKVVIELNRRYAPIPRDTRAILRQKTLLGETYVELSPGDKASGALADGGVLPFSQVSPAVQLDQIFRAFDPQTRAAFETWMVSLAEGVQGRGQDINDALGNLGPFARDTNTLVQILNAQAPEVQRLVANTGDVFNALSERDHQLSSLITNSNTVFATTAQRGSDLAQFFQALPTFESESQKTVVRLTAYALNTNPLITQLRPAARQLSPTLQSLSILAPDLKGLFRDLNPLIDASRTGLPAVKQFLDELHPFLGALDSPLRELNPILSFVGQYKQELNAFFSNTVAATEATDNPPNSTTPVHYLRTTNPFNPESLAVYPTRIGTNRPNPYQFPGAFANLAAGLPAYETRQCANGVPTLGTGLLNLIPTQLRNQIITFAYAGGGQLPAPPCKQQGPYHQGGVVTQYPHVVAAANGNTARSGR